MKEYRTFGVLLFGLFRSEWLIQKMKPAFLICYRDGKPVEWVTGWPCVVTVGSCLAEYADHIHSDHCPHPTQALL